MIPPQFDGAESFRGNYAVITVLPEGSAPLEELDLLKNDLAQALDAVK